MQQCTLLTMEYNTYDDNDLVLRSHMLKQDITE